MSTKTSIKRIALVAVSALGFGLLSVVPAKAAAVSALVVSSAATNTYTDTTTPLAAGTVLTWDLKATFTGDLASGDTGTATYTVTAGPANKNITSTCTFTAATITNLTNTVVAATGAFTFTATGAVTAAAAATLGTVACPSTIGGTYKVTSTFGTFTVSPSTSITPTATAPTDKASGSLLVSGSNVSQGTTRSTTTGAALIGGAATVLITLPTHTTNAYQIISSGVGSITTASADASATTTRVNGSTADYSAGAVVTAASSAATTATVALSSAVAGVQTITMYSTDATTGIRTAVTSASVTWGDAATVSAALSTAFIGVGTAFPTADASAGALRFPSTANSTVHATIGVTLNDATGSALNNQSVSVTVTGPGLIKATNGSGTGNQGTVRADSITAATNSTNQFRVGISADGTRGVSTVTISRGTTVIATKTVTFYGAVATLTATQGVSIMRSGRTAASTVASMTLGGVDPARLATAAIGQDTATNITLVAKDADGNVVPLAANPTAVISDTTVISAVNIASCTGGGALTVCAAGAGYYLANTVSAVGGVSGAAATVTFRTPNPAVPGAFIETAAVPFTLGGSVVGGTVTMTLDKASYEPGERMVLTYTAKDAAGNPVYDWSAVATPSSNKNVAGLSGGVFVGGTEVIGDAVSENLYAPTTSGAFIITLATGTATGATTTATATVGDDASTAAANAASDAASEAIDAANAATDAANLAAEAADAATVAAEEARDSADAATAAVEALATEVATLMAALKAQITTLANVVAKIAKRTKS